MTESLRARALIAIGRELDALAVEAGVRPRWDGETDDRLRQRVLAPLGDADLSVIVADAIEAWKTARELPYLSPTACKLLNDLIVAGLRPVLGRREEDARQAGWDACHDLSSED